LLVVSDILRGNNIFKVVGSEEYLNSTLRDSVINVQPDYRYMKLGYYVSVYAESRENRVIPRCTDIIDAYNNAVLLLRSERRGIPVPIHVATNSMEEILGRLDFPMVLFPLNPFSYDIFRTVDSKGELTDAMRSLGMNFRYPVSAQALSNRQMLAVKSIFGSVELEEAGPIAERVYEEFRIPLCKIYIQRGEGKCYLCGVSPLQPTDLKPSDLETIRKKIVEMGENF